MTSITADLEHARRGRKKGTGALQLGCADSVAEVHACAAASVTSLCLRHMRA